MVVQVGCEDHARLGILFEACSKRLYTSNKVCNFVRSLIINIIN